MRLVDNSLIERVNFNDDDFGRDNIAGQYTQWLARSEEGEDESYQHLVKIG